MYKLRIIENELKTVKGSDFFAYFELYLKKNLVQIDSTYSINFKLYDDETLILTKPLIMDVTNNEIQLYLTETELDIDIKKYDVVLELTIDTEFYKIKDIDFFVE